MSDYKLVLPFDTGHPEFVRGVEIGRLWEILKSDEGTVIAMVHITNAEMMLRISEALQRPVASEELDHNWMSVVFEGVSK